jgi:HAD superfamily hydrolase (TIGR01509 family)
MTVREWSSYEPDFEMKNDFDVVLFDNDGVLVDSEPLFLQATQELLSTVGVTVNAELYAEICLRRGASVFELAVARGLSTAEIRELRARRDERYAELIDEGVRVFDGVRATLARMHRVRPMAIVTSSGRDHFERIHHQTDLVRFFEFVLTDGDYARHKPHPDPYLMAAERFGVRPERCLVVEDTERGLAAAHAAWMRCVVIPNQLSESGNFERAERVLSSMKELAPLLGPA